MKIIRFLAIALLTVVMLAACAPQETQNPTSLSSPAEESAAAYDERMIYHSKDEFYSEVNKAKEAFEKKGDKTTDKIEEIEAYYDFKDVVKDVELYSIYVKYRYVALDYRDKEAKESGSLLLQYTRPLENIADEEQHLKQYRSRTNTVEVMINGRKVIKQEMYENADKTGMYICNQYFWVENGTGMFMSIPPWLLKLYPEETFFNIEKVELKKQAELK
jgi:hypothetical protein